MHGVLEVTMCFFHAIAESDMPAQSVASGAWAHSLFALALRTSSSSSTLTLPQDVASKDIHGI